MNKRKDFIYELTGKVTGKKQQKDKKGNPFYRIFVEIDKKEGTKYLTVFQDSLAKESIWIDIQEANYHKKDYVFFCKNYMGLYQLIDWKEIQTKNHGQLN